MPLYRPWTSLIEPAITTFRGVKTRLALTLIALLVVAAVLAGSAEASGFPRFGPGCTRADFTIGGTKVSAELCLYPDGSHDWPGGQGSLGITHAATFLRRYLR
jgi:hypothetical protein